MQSYTTLSHQRNFQGNVIIPTSNNTHRPKHRSIASLITTSILILAVAISGSLLGIMTVHNQQLKNKIQILETQNTTPSEENPCENCVPCSTNSEINTQPINTTQPPPRKKILRQIPISNQQHDTEPMPSIDND